LNETEELFDELDDVKQFIEDCLIVDPDSVVKRCDMQLAVRNWLAGLSGATGVTVSDGGSETKLLNKLKSRFPEKRLPRVQDAKRSFVYVGCRLRE
jgi:hypothetical protein